MENLKYTAFYAILFIAITLLLLSCTSPKIRNTKEVAQKQNNAKFSYKKEDDAKLLVTAAVLNLEEIQLGILAQTTSDAPYIIDLGEMMEAEHIKALVELKSLAIKKHIKLPTTLTKKEQATYINLLEKFESEFDEAYCKKIVAGHKNAVKQFERASTSAYDNEIRIWATTMLPIYRKHLDQSVTCLEKCEKKHLALQIKD